MPARKIVNRSTKKSSYFENTLPYRNFLLKCNILLRVGRYTLKLIYQILCTKSIATFLLDLLQRFEIWYRTSEIMIFKFLLLLYVITAANCQSAESSDSSTCNLQPYCSCNCGGAGSPDNSNEDSRRPNIGQGRPGKIGPRGLEGLKGQKVGE